MSAAIGASFALYLTQDMSLTDTLWFFATMVTGTIAITILSIVFLRMRDSNGDLPNLRSILIVKDCDCDDKAGCLKCAP